MRTLYSIVGSPSNLPFCHPSHLLCPTQIFPPFFLSLPLNPNPSQQSATLSSITLKARTFSLPRPLIGGASMASTASSTGVETEVNPFSVLFVCLGNICRSPAAEGVFTDLVKKRGLELKFKIDSAGTIDYHEGNEADPRMRAASKRRGIQITSISRPIRPSDFRDFDLILAMDKQNREDIFEAFNVWKVRENFPANAEKKVKLMCSYCKKHDEIEVPDPYYGGPQGFEKVLDLLEDACHSLLDSILEENKHLQDS